MALRRLDKTVIDERVRALGESLVQLKQAAEMAEDKRVDLDTATQKHFIQIWQKLAFIAVVDALMSLPYKAARICLNEVPLADAQSITDWLVTVLIPLRNQLDKECETLLSDSRFKALKPGVFPDKSSLDASAISLIKTTAKEPLLPELLSETIDILTKAVIEIALPINQKLQDKVTQTQSNIGVLQNEEQRIERKLEDEIKAQAAAAQKDSPVVNFGKYLKTGYIDFTIFNQEVLSKIKNAFHECKAPARFTVLSKFHPGAELAERIKQVKARTTEYKNDLIAFTKLEVALKKKALFDKYVALCQPMITLLEAKEKELDKWGDIVGDELRQSVAASARNAIKALETRVAEARQNTLVMRDQLTRDEKALTLHPATKILREEKAKEGRDISTDELTLWRERHESQAFVFLLKEHCTSLDITPKSVADEIVMQITVNIDTLIMLGSVITDQISKKLKHQVEATAGIAVLQSAMLTPATETLATESEIFGIIADFLRDELENAKVMQSIRHFLMHMADTKEGFSRMTDEKSVVQFSQTAAFVQHLVEHYLPAKTVKAIEHIFSDDISLVAEAVTWTKNKNPTGPISDLLAQANATAETLRKAMVICFDAGSSAPLFTPPSEAKLAQVTNMILKPPQSNSMLKSQLLHLDALIKRLGQLFLDMEDKYKNAKEADVCKRLIEIAGPLMEYRSNVSHNGHRTAAFLMDSLRVLSDSDFHRQLDHLHNVNKPATGLTIPIR